jgi:hypothetical protein
MKIGLIAVGLNTYWHQFGGLRERLDGYRNAIKEKMEAYGGQIVACGTPEQIAACPESFTGQYLKKLLK